MKICFVTTGDIEILATMKRATGMALPLMEMGHEVAIAMLDTKNNRDRIKLEAPNVKCLFFKEGNFLSEIIQKNRLIKKWKPDLVYVCAFVTRNFIYGNYLKDVITLVEHSELRSAIQDNKPYKRKVELFLEKFSLTHFNGQIVASKYLENHFRKLMNKKGLDTPILYSPYAYNKTLLQPINESRLTKKYENQKIILYMGRLYLNYGFLDIIKATEELLKQRNDFKLLIMGNGRDKEMGVEYVKKKSLEKNIEFLGYVAEEDLSSYFSLADIFVSPIANTTQDMARCPSKLYMYLAFQKPIITCKVGEGESLFGSDGYYYEPGQIVQLANLIDESFESNKLKYNIDVNNHTWNHRTEEFLIWVKINFNKN